MAFFYAVNIVVQILFYLFGALLVAGLIQPWWVLWWMSHQNRLKVLKYYGVPWLVTGTSLLIMS